ncbi:MFS transporter [Aestuariivirga sp.]|uniref:MFS transporter n=1 Tax=Aestuariivirga sp. TaxID=2650926 RepID=UPI0039E3476E
MKEPSTKIAARQLPSGIWALGFVSMLMDISSEMIHALLPIYLVTVLGTSTLTVGVIEGIAEATASITKIFSGALSDWLGKRKVLAVIGYGLAAVTKPIFPLATTIEWLVAARFIDRLGKGIRGAPRDALLADIAPPDARGASFGLRQALDNIGAFSGPLIAILVLWLHPGDFSLVFWIAVLPAFLSVFFLMAFVEEPPRPAALRKVKMPLSRSEISQFGAGFWSVIAVGVVFTLARFSEAFLILRAQQSGMQAYLIPAVLVVMNIVYSLAAYPAGVLSDRIGRGGILAAGLVLLVMADLALGLSTTLLGVMLGVVLWGLHMGLTQGILSSMVADTAPPELRGTAFGVFNLLTGIATLIASVVAGALWDSAGYQATFLAGSIFAALALAGLGLLKMMGGTPKTK